MHVDFLGTLPSSSFGQKWEDLLATGTVTVPAFVAAVAASEASAQYQVVNTYQDVLDRAGAPAHVAAWTSLLERHEMTRAQLAATFYATDEWMARFGGGTTSTWVEALYERLVGWTPSEASHAKWVAAAEAHGRFYVALVFYESYFAARDRVKHLYVMLPHNIQNKILHWVAVDESQGDLAVKVAFADSSEYFTDAQSRCIGPPGTCPTPAPFGLPFIGQGAQPTFAITTPAQ